MKLVEAKTCNPSELVSETDTIADCNDLTLMVTLQDFPCSIFWNRAVSQHSQIVKHKWIIIRRYEFSGTNDGNNFT